MANLPFSLADLDILGTDHAYLPSNPKYAFKHLLFSVTEPQFRVKLPGVSDNMWEEALQKLEGMERADRERLWPQLVMGFKGLSQRLKIQDETIASDSKRLRITQSNVKMLQRQLQADILPWIQRMKKDEQVLQQRLIRVMRIVEVLEGKGCRYRIPLAKGEAELAMILATLTQQLKGSGVGLCGKVQNLLMASHVSRMGFGGYVHLPRSTKVHEKSLVELKVLQQQTEAIEKLGSALKRDIRHMRIMKAEDVGTT